MVRGRHSSGPANEPESSAHAFARLRRANLAVGLIHLAQAVCILALANTFAIPVTATFQDGPPGTPPNGRSFTLFDLRFGWAIAVFLGLAAVDHLLMASPRIVTWYESQLRGNATRPVGSNTRSVRRS